MDLILSSIEPTANDALRESPNFDGCTWSPIPRHRYKILLVEDDPDQLNLFRYMLEVQGFKVRVAISAGEAVSIYLEDKIDLVISDLRMPGMGGLELVRYLRGLDGNVETPVIIISSGSQPMEHEVFDLGATSFCRKAEASNTLISQISDLLS